MLDLLPTSLEHENESVPSRGAGGKTRPKPRERLYARIQEHPLPGIELREIDAHFRSMPARYWEQVTKTDLIWALETVHAFKSKLTNAPYPRATVMADWRHCPERGFTKILLCAWDRPGLLAKMAAAFSALRVNILRADVYTRADNLALDVFHVCGLDRAHVANTTRLEHLVFLLEGALSEPPRFASVWASQFHKTLTPPVRTSPRVSFDNENSAEYTQVRVEASDRLGLLHDLLLGLSECGLNIAQALVETDDAVVSDMFYVTDLAGKKIADPVQLETIRSAVIRALHF